MESTRKQKAHLWIYNNPFYGVSDQIDYFVLSLKQNGYEVTVGKQPRNDAINVVIENFSDSSAQTLIDFCSENNKKVAVIMTEHIDLIGGYIYMHGEKLWTYNDYMHPHTQVTRLRNLIACQQYIRSFFVLGDLPVLDGFSDLFIGIPVHKLPFPRLEYITSEKEPLNDGIFTGFVTEHRQHMLKVISKSHSISCPTVSKFLSRAKRGHLYEDSKLVLNLPQRPEWRWLSLMRIIAALKHGRATVSIGTNDKSEISECVFQIPFDHHVNKNLDSYLQDWRKSYTQAYEGYMAMAKKFESANRFPNELFEYWGILEGLK